MSATSTTSTQPAAAPAQSAGRSRGGARLTDLVWLTWRQHRSVVISGLALVAVLIGGLVTVAARISTINQECGNTVCPTGSPQAQELGGAFGLSNLSAYLIIVVLFLPLLIGMFLGVPLLAREHEQRTLLLAWSQDVTPQRWLWTKAVLLGAVIAALGTAVSAAVGHAADVASVADGQSLFFGTPFLVTGMIPLAQCVVWFVVGVAVGAAFRRTLPAVFAVLAGYIAVFFFVQWRYPTFMKPLTAFVPIGSDKDLTAQIGANALTISEGGPGTIVDAAGHPVSPATVQSLCSSGDGKLVDGLCLARHHYQAELLYQPGSRIPDFHLILAGGYVGIGLIALAAVWVLVRRTSLSAG